MDDSESLFEGMVLFNPNSSFLEEQEQVVIVPESSLPPPPPKLQTLPEETPPNPIGLETASSEPLEESLFSDLTITAATAAAPGPVDSGFSRQISRKKKRASFRIGYGRSYGEDDNDGGETAPGDRAPLVPSAIEESDQNSGFGDDDEEVRLGQIKASIAERLESARRSAAEAAEALKEAITRRRGAADRVRAASESRAELERQLDEACESEDFEAAERLSDGLASADAERVSLVAALRDVEAQCDAAEARMEAALASQMAAEEDCALMLDGFAKDALRKADLVIRTAQETSSKKMDEWNSSTEALDLRTMELEIESQIVNEARTGLNKSIEHLVEDDMRERESLREKKDVLVDELQKLLLLVKQKEKAIAETESDIEVVDKRIAGVVSGFQEMQSVMDSKIGYLQSGLSEIEVQSRDYLSKKKEIDVDLAREEEKGAKLRELGSASAEEAKMYLDIVGLRKNLMVSVLKSREDKLKLAKIEEKLSNEVQMLQHEISTSRASLQELSTRKSSIQQEIAASKQKLLFIDKRIPELEAEKKVAAAARNFKEAGRIATEAKSLTVEKDGLRVSMESAVLDLKELEGEIKGTVEKLQETESLVSSKEKEVAMARFERLLLIAGSAKAESAAALEFGNREEADLLLTEAEAADSEAKALESIHDFKIEEFVNIPKHFISEELVANLGKKQLEELTALVQVSPA